MNYKKWDVYLIVFLVEKNRVVMGLIWFVIICLFMLNLLILVKFDLNK